MGRFDARSLWLGVALMATTGTALAQRQLTSADYDRAARMLGDRLTPLLDDAVSMQTWLDDGTLVWKQHDAKGDRFLRWDAASGTIAPLFDPAKVAAGLAAASPKAKVDAAKLPIFAIAKADGGYALTTRSGVFTCTAAGQCQEKKTLGGDEPGTPSPDGSRAAFIRDWNLWLRDLATGKETQLTFDGKTDYGYATNNAGWQHGDEAILVWSPDGRKIATFQQDQRKTSTMTMVETNIGAPKVQQWKYPFPGDKDVTMIERVIIDLAGAKPKMIRLQLPPEQHRSTFCDDISCNGGWEDVQWSHDGKTLAFVSTDRAHKSAQLRVADAATGKVRDVMREDVATHFESGQGEVGWKYLSKSGQFLWSSQRSGWQHLYLYDGNGKLIRQLTSGEWPIIALQHVDEGRRMAWFNAAGRQQSNPYLSQMYRVSLEGGDPVLLTPDAGYHQVKLSPDAKYLVDVTSTVTQAPVVTVRDAMTGKALQTLARTDLARLKAAGWKPLEEFTVKGRDGKTDLYGHLFKPTDFDPAKKYPVVVYIYPGPQSQSTRARYFVPAHLDHNALAELGFIVIAVDGMGTPNRGKAFHDTWYGNMGDNTLPDQVATLKQLGERYPWFDTSRVGIWGHSGGGYASTGAILRYPDVFKVAISEAGNHDNRSYEDDWGERYVGLLEKKDDGTSNYDDQANAAHAKNLKGKLFLIHGMLDDNVPVQNTLLVADALMAANKDFDLLLLPQARHGFGKYGNYITRKRWDYFVQHLMGATPPAGYELKPAP